MWGQLGALDFYCEPNEKIIGRNVGKISIGKLEGRNKNSCWEKENTAEDHYDLTCYGGCYFRNLIKCICNK